MLYQGGVARFNKAAGTFTLFPPPAPYDGDLAQQSMVMPSHVHAGEGVWTNDVNRRAILRLDPSTGKYELIDPFANAPASVAHTPYGMATDASDNLWFMDFGDRNIGRIDARTGVATLYPTPTRGSHPRRGMIANGAAWFAEFAVDKLGAFDIASESFREWAAPTPYSFPYDANLDRAGDLWSANMADDRVSRLRPDTGESVEYLLPARSNIRRVFIDNATPRPTFWAGNNHGAEIIRLEPTD